jgi:hypothetical protein
MNNSLADLPSSFENPVACVPSDVQEAFFRKKYINLYKIFSRFSRINYEANLLNGENS